jgi:hypothetical protein
VSRFGPIRLPQPLVADYLWRRAVVPIPQDLAFGFFDQKRGEREGDLGRKRRVIWGEKEE